MAKTKAKSSTLYLYCDLGTSGLKIIGSKDHAQKAIMLSPEIIEIGETTLNDLEFVPGDCVNSIWVKIADRYFAIGNLAKDLMATAILSQSKSGLACERIAGITWLMAKHFGLSHNFDVSLVCLLPPGELKEKDVLAVAIAKTLENFEAPDGSYQVKAAAVQCLPEGIGIYKNFTVANSPNLIDLSIGVVMLGHRNTSFFAGRNERVSTFRSSEIGFWKMIQDLGLADDRLAAGISEWLSSKEDKILREILRDRKMVNLEENLASLKSRIIAAKEIQTRAIKLWLSEISSKVDLVLIAGGAADSFREELIEYFDDVLPEFRGTGKTGIFFHYGSNPGLKVPELHRARFMDISCVYYYNQSH
jgi:hypothetical protein